MKKMKKNNPTFGVGGGSFDQEIQAERSATSR